MDYNFKSEDLKSKDKIEEYKGFAQEVLENMQAVREVFQTLSQIKPTASLTSKIGALNYKGVKTEKGSGETDYSVFARGEIYSADRLRQVIQASQRGGKVAINAIYQEGTGLRDDPFVDVAEISFQYNADTQEIQLGEVLDTEQLAQMREEIKNGVSKVTTDSELEEEEEEK